MNNGFFDEFKNAWNKPNNALIQIIIINVVVFAVVRILHVFFIFGGAEGTFNFLLGKLELPSNVGTFLLQPWTIVTYFFTHFDFLHILFNMLFLYWFGRIINEFLGSKRVIELYVLGGLFGGLLYIVLYNIIPFYAGRVDASLMLGASAGVYAIVVGATVFMPNYTIFLMFLGPVRIKYIAIFYIFMSFIQTTGSNAGGEIAHLGGAFAGWLFISQLNKGNDIGEWIIKVINFVKSMFAPQPKIKVSHRKEKSFSRAKRTSKSKGSTSSSSKSNPDQSEIDAILDKISNSGYESLTKEEKQKLFNASKN